MFQLLFLVIIIIIGVGIYLAKSYNTMQQFGQSVKEANANVIASLKKRLDLTNRIMDIAQSYAEHEKLIHISVANSLDIGNIAGVVADCNQAMSRVAAIATQFPDLKANTTYQQLMDELKSLESNLQYKREEYNKKVSIYNTNITSVPQVFFAQKFGFTQAPYFNIDGADDLNNVAQFNMDSGENLNRIIGSVADKISSKVKKQTTTVEDVKN